MTYNRTAVDREIAKDKRIAPKEARAIHALLRGHRCWFDTLNDALDAEGLTHLGPLGVNVGYGETMSFASGGQWISVYRNLAGTYERPVHYATKITDTYPQGD